MYTVRETCFIEEGLKDIWMNFVDVIIVWCLRVYERVLRYCFRLTPLTFCRGTSLVSRVHCGVAIWRGRYCRYHLALEREIKHISADQFANEARISRGLETLWCLRRKEMGAAINARNIYEVIGVLRTGLTCSMEDIMPEWREASDDIDWCMSRGFCWGPPCVCTLRFRGGLRRVSPVPVAVINGPDNSSGSESDTSSSTLSSDSANGSMI